MTSQIIQSALALDQSALNALKLTNPTYTRDGTYTAILETKLGVAMTSVGEIVVVIGFIFILYYGFVYMTAGGDGEKTKKATLGMLFSAIGIAIIALSYVITFAVMATLK